MDDLQLVVEVRALGSAAPYGVGNCTGVSPLTVESPAATGTLTPSERFPLPVGEGLDGLKSARVRLGHSA